MGGKHNDVVIVNPKSNKENMKIHIRNHVHENSWYTCVHTYNNQIQVKEDFYNEVISF